MNQLLQKGWLNRKVFTGISVLLILATAFISIFLSLMIAQNQAITKETKRLRDITNGVLMRMSTTRVQFGKIVHHFSAVDAKDACAPQHVQKMQEFNVSGVFLQAVAHISGTRIDCSSISEVLNGLDLGPPNQVEPNGTRLWANIKIPNWEDSHLVVMEKAGWAIMFVPSHTIEALGHSDVMIGVFGIQPRRLYTARGEIPPEWIEQFQGKQALTFVDKKRQMLVYIEPNKLNLTAVITAMPLQDIHDDMMTFVQILIPLVLLIGLLLGGIFVYMQRTRYSTKSSILRALANHEFYLEYQPIINLENKLCVGAEALIRWRTAQNQFISPETFIPAAETAGVITQITQRVFELVAKDLRNILNENPDFHVGINISPQDIRSGNLLPLIRNLKKSTGAQGNQILIEVTERGFLDDEEALNTIQSIRDCGVRVAIDDFGTGYSSLSYLTKFQLDYLKIDKTFVDSVGTDAVTSHVAFHIIEMAKTLQLGMVAEGVETWEQARILQERGVKYVQGWLFSRSLKRRDFYAYLDQQAAQPDTPRLLKTRKKRSLMKK